MWSVWAAVTGYRHLVACEQQILTSHSSEGWEVQGQGAAWLGASEAPDPLTVCSCGWWVGGSPLGSLSWALIPFTSFPPHGLGVSQRLRLQTPSHWASGLHTSVLGGYRYSVHSSREHLSLD